MAAQVQEHSAHTADDAEKLAQEATACCLSELEKVSSDGAAEKREERRHPCSRTGNQRPPERLRGRGEHCRRKHAEGQCCRVKPLLKQAQR